MLRGAATKLAAAPFLGSLHMTLIPIFRPRDRALEVDIVRTNQVQGGVSTGFKRLDEYFSIKRGYPITIAGEPYHGKSQFIKQILVNLSKMHGYKHCVYLGEDGTPEEIIIELQEIYLKKPIRAKDKDGNTLQKPSGAHPDCIDAARYVFTDQLENPTKGQYFVY